MFENANVELIKRCLHTAQAFLVFIVWALTLAIFTKGGYTGGQIAFIFALCFITVPALIYQVAIPHFPRTRRFASVYAFTTIDILFTLLWFSAAVAVAAWTTAGINQAKDADGTCNRFDYGDTSKCNISRADAAFGFIVCFIFAGAAYISIVFLKRYRQTGEMPGVSKSAYRPTTDVMGKGVWSANVEERESIEETDERRLFGQPVGDDEEELLRGRAPSGLQAENDPHPGSRIRFSGTAPTTGQHYDSYAPTALSPDGYNTGQTAYRPPPSTSPLGPRLDFPAGDYDRV